MNITTIVPPEYEPVTLADCWAHLRLTPSGSPLSHPDDDMLERHITTAREEVEAITHRALVRQKVRLSVPNFCRLFLQRPPLISVESVQYYDTANVLQTMALDQYYVTDDLVPELCVVNNAWPGTYQRRDAVRVTYWVGYPGDSSPDTERDEQLANVPKRCKDATLVGVELLHASLTPEKRTNLEKFRASMLAGLTVPVVA